MRCSGCDALIYQTEGGLWVTGSAETDDVCVLEVDGTTWAHEPRAQSDGVSPNELWHRAYALYPEDRQQRRTYYHRLMVEHGHIVKRQQGDDTPVLPCGWEPTDG